MEGIGNRVRGECYEKLMALREEEEKHTMEDSELRFSVPRIVVIGEESSGKSSTLERIASFKFFPSDRRLCTRMPIELRLRFKPSEKIEEQFRESGYVMMKINKSINSRLPHIDEAGPLYPHEVEPKVKEWMENLVRCSNGEVVGVIQDCMVIQLFSSKRVNLDLIDMPGIVAGSIKNEPSNMMELTRDLASSYLNHPHTIVVVVVPATENRIRNSQAMELVQRHNKENLSIGALTMVDLASDTRSPENPFWQLKDRINGVADDLPSLGYGYVALKNRDTSSADLADLTLVNTEEAKWFDGNLQGISNCGINSLVDELIKIIEGYIESTWVPSESERLRTLHMSIEKRLVQLGPVITRTVDLLDMAQKALPGSIDLWSQWSYSSIEDACLKHFAMGSLTNMKFVGCNEPDVFFSSFPEKMLYSKEPDYYEDCFFYYTSSKWRDLSINNLSLADLQQKEYLEAYSILFIGEIKPNGLRKGFFFPIAANFKEGGGFGKVVKDSISGLYRIDNLRLTVRAFYGVDGHTTDKDVKWTKEPGSTATASFSIGENTTAPPKMINPFAATGPSSVNTSPDGKPKVRVKRGDSASTPSSGFVEHQLTKRVLLYHPPWRHPFSNVTLSSLNANCENHFKDIHKFRMEIFAIERSVTKEILEAHVEEVTTLVRRASDRFVNFIHAFLMLTTKWCKDRRSSISTKWANWVDMNLVGVSTADELTRLFTPLPKFRFRNPIITELSRIIYNEIWDHSFNEFIASIDFMEGLAQYGTESDLCIESCADARNDLKARSLITQSMLQVLLSKFDRRPFTSLEKEA